MLKLNLGSGVQHWAGFTNVDLYVTPKQIKDQIKEYGDADGSVFVQKGSKFVQADIKHLPFKDNSVDLIETIDVVEHFGFRELKEVGAEFKRVLKPGAICKIQTIDFNGLAQNWVDFIANNPTTQLAEYIDLMMSIYGNQIDTGQFHKSAWTPAFAQYLFIGELQFSNITVSVFPRGCGTYPPMETIWFPKGNVYKYQALYIELIK